MHKVCTYCSLTKALTEFPNKLGVKDAICKPCMALKKKEYRKSKQGLVARIYSHQKSCSVRRGHIAPEYSLEEFREWVYSQPLFYTLYDDWVNSGYVTKLSPSVDREYNDVHYCFDNIRLMTFQQNMQEPRKKFKHI